MLRFLQVLSASAQQHSCHAQVCSTFLLNFHTKDKLLFFISRLLFLQFAPVCIRNVTSAFMVLCLLCCSLFLECWASLFLLVLASSIALLQRWAFVYPLLSVCIELGSYSVTLHGGGAGLENRRYLVRVSHFALKK